MIPIPVILPGASQHLPASLATAAPMRLERRVVERPGDPFTVLLIEDDQTIRALICRYLVSGGYAVLEAEDGQSGLELLERHPGRIDLVLTDIDMPRIDGITIAGVLETLRPLIGVICMSGTASRQDPAEALSALGPARFLAKPFTAERLTHALDDELARVQELAAVAESSQSISRSLGVERRLMQAVDLVASGLRLQRGMPGRARASRESLQA